MNNEESKIKEFLFKMANQDNRATKAPYFYVIRTSVKRPAFSGCGEIVEYYNPEYPEETYESVEEYVKQKKIDYEYDEMTNIEKEEFDKIMIDIEYSLDSIEYTYDWKEEGMFLTEDDAKEHLRRNYYHYSDDAHTYIKHSWRAPELEEFFKSLFEYFKVKKGNLDL